VDTGAHQQLERLPDFTVNDARFDPSGRLVIVASQDGKARIFDRRTGTLLAALATSRAPTLQAQFSSLRGPMVTLDVDLGLRTYACDICGSTGDLLRTSSRLLTRRLTSVERARYLGKS
jgi:WD40 repeat protein